MAFHLGSLGFLTPFQFNNFQDQVTNVLEGHAALTLRSRLRCIIVRKNQKDDPTEDRKNKSVAELQNGKANSTHNDSLPSTNILVLNEVVIDRGPSPYLSNIDLFLDGKHITSVQGDGMIELCMYIKYSLTNIFDLSRSDRINTNWFYSLCSRCRCFDDPSISSSNHGDSNLSSFIEFPANCCPSWS